MPRLTYIKGPVAIAVLLDGKPWGTIKRRAGVWLASAPGFRPGDNGPFKGDHTFKYLRDAKKRLTQLAK